MQMHEGITGHTQIVYAFCGVVKSKFHPLRAGELGYGTRRIYRRTLLRQQAFQPSQHDSYLRQVHHARSFTGSVAIGRLLIATYSAILKRAQTKKM